MQSSREGRVFCYGIKNEKEMFDGKKKTIVLSVLGGLSVIAAIILLVMASQIKIDPDKPSPDDAGNLTRKTMLRFLGITFFPVALACFLFAGIMFVPKSKV